LESKLTIEELKEKTISSAKWNISGQVMVQVLNILGTIILSRLLPPSDFGILIMLTLVSNYANLVLNNVVGSAVVQNQQLSRPDFSSIFWFNMIISVVFALILVIGKNALATFYGQPDLVTFINTFSLIFIFYGLGSVSQALLVRQHNFRQVVIGNIVAMIVSYVIAIAMVFSGYRVEALVVQLLSNTLIASLYFVVAAKWKPVMKLQVQAIRKISKFSGNLFLNSSLEYLAYNIDSFLVGKSFGSKDLGLYGRAKQLVFLPVQNIAFAISRSFFPAFAQLQHDKAQLQQLYLSSIRITFFVTTTVIVYMVVVANDLVYILMGEQWIGMVLMFQLFSLTGITGTLNGFNDSFISSQGRTDLLLRLGIFEKLLYLASSFIGLRYGIYGMIYARLIATVVILVPKVYLLLYVVKLPMGRFIRNLSAAIFINLILLGLGTLVVYGMGEINVYLRFIVVSIIFALLAVVFSYIFREKAFFTLMKIARQYLDKFRRRVAV
jgi:O-antigen/teichoic acid export membrane protein